MDIIPTNINKTEHEKIDEPIIEVGQWYWVKDIRTAKDENGNCVEDKNGEWKEEEYKWFGCVVNIGSNYIEVEGPWRNNSGHKCRIHIDEFYDECEFESDPQGVILKNSQETQEKLRIKMNEINELSKRLGVTPSKSLPQSSTGYALVPLNGQDNIGLYKRDLIKARDKELPVLFEELKELNYDLAMWLSAESVSMKTMANQMEKSIDLVSDRIFHVELYAGLTEKIERIKEGKPADISEKLHLMQRRCYMDEECLVDYQAGGMTFQKIEEFDRWLMRIKNLNRILPFPRCMVSFRVRRDKKEREENLNPYINLNLEEEDKTTFLYVRNGGNVYRINSSLDFGEKLFPDSSEFHPGEKVWAKLFGNKVETLISDREYQDRKKEEKEANKLYDKWEKENPEKHYFHNPYRDKSSRGWGSNISGFKPCDDTNVYFDDIKKHIEQEAKQYNRIALIIQGLYDRSQILHPHSKVILWNQEGFQSAVKLVYDHDKALVAGDKPDFEAYRSRLNASLKIGSIVVGQQDFWRRKEAKKENKRQEGDWRIKNPSHYIQFSPYGNPGPGLIAKIVKYTKTKKCTFKWERERVRYTYYNDSKIECSISISSEFLLNIDAYEKDDYKQFFNDPRTRQEYLKWAPLLLAAEDCIAGKTSDKETLNERYSW